MIVRVVNHRVVRGSKGVDQAGVLLQLRQMQLELFGFSSKLRLGLEHFSLEWLHHTDCLQETRGLLLLLRQVTRVRTVLARRAAALLRLMP